MIEVMSVQFQRTLGNLSQILGKAQAYAEQKKFDPSVLLQARLAPDMFDLTRQVQIACDTAKFFVARLSGKDAPKWEDNEKSIPELQARIDKTIQYLQSFKASDFTGWEAVRTTNPRREGKFLIGSEFALQHAIPNFFFHITAAYAILRKNGLDIGKKDYLGELNWQDL
jgi:hypothetical protein